MMNKYIGLRIRTLNKSNYWYAEDEFNYVKTICKNQQSLF